MRARDVPRHPRGSVVVLIGTRLETRDGRSVDWRLAWLACPRRIYAGGAGRVSRMRAVLDVIAPGRRLPGTRLS